MLATEVASVLVADVLLVHQWWLLLQCSHGAVVVGMDATTVVGSVEDAAQCVVLADASVVCSDARDDVVQVLAFLLR